MIGHYKYSVGLVRPNSYIYLTKLKNDWLLKSLLHISRECLGYYKSTDIGLVGFNDEIFLSEESMSPTVYSKENYRKWDVTWRKRKKNPALFKIKVSRPGQKGAPQNRI